MRFLKSTFMQVEDAPQLFGLRHKDYARTHKIAAARILARLGLEDGKRYLRRNYVQTPFKRVHPEDEDLPKRDMAASTSELYRLVKKETNDGREIIIRFVGIMKGYYPEYKPHLRMAAAKELIRQIEFDYDDEPTRAEPVGASLVGAHDSQPSTSDESNPNPIPDSELTIDNSDDAPTNQPNPENPSSTVTPTSDRISTDQSHSENPVHPVNPDTDKKTNPVNSATPASSASTNQPNPAHPTNPDSDKIIARQPNHTNHSSDEIIPDWIQDFANPYTQYAIHNCAEEAESIYHSIIRRSADQPDADSARRKATGLIGEFNEFMAGRDPEYEPISVPDDLLTKSLTQRMEAPESYLFDPADFFDLDRDDFYYCRCGGCEECDELDYFLEFMYELQEDYDQIFEDP